MSFLFDYDRPKRIALPESVFCEGKPFPALSKLVAELLGQKKPILLTRLSSDIYESLGRETAAKIDYEPISRTGFINGTLKPRRGASVAIVAAGTSDLPVSMEASRTLTHLGIKNTMITDVGVAGVWRLMKNIPRINKHAVVIAVAGMDAALVSVLGGLTPKPIIGVPTSCGYGVSEKGQSALRSMLCSCAPGVTVMNIDNGYGAACAAARILSL